MAEVTRARPLLGTYVSVRLDGLPPSQAHRAVDLAFAEVERVQRLMSFHDAVSDLGRINRDAARDPVTVDPQTWRVLANALRIARLSDGRFDPCVAPRLVALGLLPRPASVPPADPLADWRDVQLLADHRVRLRRPLWLDLGGIAKGYAVDRAVARLRACGATAACVNAGGDLRLYGPDEEVVAIVGDNAAARPVIALRNAALATSASEPVDAHFIVSGRPLDGRGARDLAPGWQVSVVAPQAWLADALTKVVLADPEAGDAMLAGLGAQVFVQRPAEFRRSRAA